MYNIVIKNIENKYEYNELIKVFLRPDQFAAYTESEYAEQNPYGTAEFDTLVVFNEAGFTDKNHIKREIFLGLLLIFQIFPACVGLAYATIRHAIRKFKKLED